MRFSFFRDFLTPASARARRVGRRPTPRARLRLEPLEDRCLLSGGIILTPSEPAPQLVGDPVTWTATAPNAPSTLVYQFSVGSPGGPFHMVRDFSPDNHFTWAPMQEGTYRVEVTIKDGFDASDTQSAVVVDQVDSRVTGDQAVITPTSNPLVALYSAPPGPEGTVHVEFAVASDNPSWQSTNDLPSLPSRSTNFFIAGMLPDTTYEMRDVFSDGTTSAPLLFTTGSIPSTVNLPSFTVVQPPGPGSDTQQDLLFQQLGNPPAGFPNPYATDLAGNVVWYYDFAQAGLHGEPAMAADLLPGGTVLLTGADSHATLAYSQDVLREIDLAGNTVRETNLDAINAQLTAMGYNNIYSLTHDATRLPNGQTAVIGLTERTVNINGTPTNYVGADIVVLDKNFQVSWVWDSFDHLDVNRGPTLGEAVQAGVLDPDAAVPNLPAVDWLHANSVDWSPADGNLTVSLRNQDWVIKIDYENGAGDGHVIWRLGQGGDFTVNSTASSPWFTHQHDAHFIDDTTMIVFDDGDVRRASDPTADSRGQVWKIDEQTLTATLVFNADLGNYSDALGSAQRLSNGNYAFDSGRQGQRPHQFGQSIEVQPDGSKAYVLQVSQPVYRAFRVQTLYEGISDQLAGDGGGEASQQSDDFQALPFGNWQQADGSPDTEALVKGAELSARYGNSSSIAAASSSLDDLQPVVAAALTASSRLLALPSTPTVLIPENVERLDQLFADGLDDRTNLVLLKAKRNLLSFGDEEDTIR
jgi:arylsulfate sulfotransferase